MSNFDYSQLKVPADYGDHRGQAMGRALTAGEFDADLKAMIDHGDLEHVHQDDVGQVILDLAGKTGPVVLTVAEAKKGILILTGAISANAEVRFPAGIRKTMAVFNRTTTAHQFAAEELVSISAGNGSGLKAVLPPRPDNLVLIAVDSSENNVRSWGLRAGGYVGKKGKLITASENWTAPDRVFCVECWMVGGGGGGASNSVNDGYQYQAGGGGAGCSLHFTALVVPGQVYPFVIGSGGLGGLSAYNQPFPNGVTGGVTQAFGRSAYGGGGGGGQNNAMSGGGSGGAGGPGGTGSAAGGTPGPAGTDGRAGFAGGQGSSPNSGGGGGGTHGDGVAWSTNPPSSSHGYGGKGLPCASAPSSRPPCVPIDTDIAPTSVIYAGDTAFGQGGAAWGYPPISSAANATCYGGGGNGAKMNVRAGSGANGAIYIEWEEPL